MISSSFGKRYSYALINHRDRRERRDGLRLSKA
jgi:hypothetical protein